MEAEGPLDDLALALLTRAGFLIQPTLGGLWARLPFDMGESWEDDRARWAASMLAAARYQVTLVFATDPPYRSSTDKHDAVAGTALFHEQLVEAAAELRSAQEAYEPGELMEPYPRVLTDALAQFLDLAPTLIAYVRGLQTAPPSGHTELLLNYFENSLELARQSEGYALALWLAEGEQLIDLAIQAAAQTLAATAPRAALAVGAIRPPSPVPPSAPARIR
ncbi:hypothetical protein [Streptomyces yangpuensis]|uniref:hypothetical protein n=1 Tax=Streptomyces yangpuensis TaxID=1648182 RepID=UPI0037F30037